MIKIIKEIKNIGIALILSTVLTGCGPFDGNIDVSSSDKSSINLSDDLSQIENKGDYITVGFSQLGSESVWRAANSKSVRDALTLENGFILEFNNARQKQENQIKAIRGFISQRVDYIAFSPVTEDGWDTVLQEAKDAGIPVILVDRKIGASKSDLYTTWVGTNAREEGEKAAYWLEDYLKETNSENKQINIVVLQGTIGSSAQLGRSMGFDSISDTHSNWHIVKQDSADFTTAKGKEVMSELLTEFEGKIDVVVSQNDDMTFGAIEAINEAGLKTGKDGDIILISFDAVKDALLLVEKGIINVDIECNPEQGEYIADIIKKLENGEPIEKENVVKELVFTQENVKDYIDDRAY